MLIDRRMLLGGAAGLMGLAAAPAVARVAPRRPIGIQLYTLREIFAKDPHRTLEQVARVGYQEVEFGGGGYDTMDHAALRRTLDRVGLRAPSMHVGYDALMEQLDSSIAMANTLGADTIVLPAVSGQHRTQAGWGAVLPNLDRIGEKLKAAGLGFAYHNHSFEFTTIHSGVSMFDRLLAGTDPALVRVELDLYWVEIANEDPIDLMRRAGQRLWAFHVKDKRPDGVMTTVGKGTMDFRRLLHSDAAKGVKHLFVENDQSPAPYLPDVTASYRALRSMGI